MSDSESFTSLPAPRFLSWQLLLPLFAAFLAAGCGADNNGEFSVDPTVYESKRLVVDDAVIDADDVFAVIDPVWWTANIYDGVPAYEKSLSSFSYPQRLVFAVVWYRSEVNNGGHDQFYYNSTGIVWPDAVEAFQTVGLDGFADILGESADRFSRPPSRDRETRNEQMESDEPDFDDLDMRFYDLDTTDKMDRELMRYIRRHRADFYFDGDVSVPQ